MGRLISKQENWLIHSYSDDLGNFAKEVFLVREQDNSLVH